MEEMLLSDSSNEIIYIFPEHGRSKGWIQELSKSKKVLFIPQGHLKVNFSLAKICRQYHVDILHLHFYGPLFSFLIQPLSHTKVISHFHNMADRRLGKWGKIINWLVSHTHTKFVGCSLTVKQSLIEEGFSEKKCTYITNCIDFSRLDLSQNPDVFKNGKKNLLLLGTDFHRKGLDIAVKAIEPIAKKYNIALQIPCYNSEKAIQFINQALGHKCDFCEFPPLTNCIGDYYRACDLFLAPSRAEGLCYAILEAIYCKTLLLKSNIREMNYNISHEEIFTFDGTVENLTHKIEYMLNMPIDEKEKFLDDLQKEIICNNSVEIWGKQLVQLYLDLYHPSNAN